MTIFLCFKSWPEMFSAKVHIPPESFCGVGEGKDGTRWHGIIQSGGQWIIDIIIFIDSVDCLNFRFPNNEFFANRELNGWQRNEALKAVLYCHRIGEVEHGAVPALPYGDAETEGHQDPVHKCCWIPASGPLHPERKGSPLFCFVGKTTENLLFFSVILVRCFWNSSIAITMVIIIRYIAELTMIAFLKDLSHQREITGNSYQNKFLAKTVQFLF